jgi:phage-related protein
MAAYITLNDLPVSTQSAVRRTNRAQRARFGDGYSQSITDGLNAQREIWDISTGAIPKAEADGIESYLLRKGAQAFQWSPPDSTKSFTAQFEGGSLILGFTNLASVTLTSYTRPTNYTANLLTGILTAVTIPDLTDVSVRIVLNPRNFQIQSGWEKRFLSCEWVEFSFTLEQSY